MSATDIKSNGGLLEPLANVLGATEPALKLLISILLGYPLAALYHKFIKSSPVEIRHLYSALCGLLIYVFNYGLDVYHSLSAIFGTYIACRFLSDSKHFVLINFIFNMGYLLVGYYFTESNDYDIKWTMPHCVLTLRLIGFGFDIADGKKPKEKLSKDQLENRLQRMPSILELCGFAYFPASFLVGPQFPFQRYEKFIYKEFEKYSGNIEAGLKRGGIGILYLIIRQIGAVCIPDSYLLSENFTELSLLMKILTIGIWGKISLYKYVSCWLITEGALICFGLTYCGIDKTTGKADWTSCSNIHLRIFELATKMEHYVKSFNVNTNQWLAQYVYKRLKFLGNRTISYAAALLFLAMWHGFHSGYYMAFMLEYMVITFEKQFHSLWSKYVEQQYSNLLNSQFGTVCVFVLMKFYNTACMGYCMVPFVYLNYTKYLQIYKTLYFYGYVFLVVWFTLNFLIQKQLRDKKFKEQKKEF